jgi:LysR family transcriptional regulator, glycine cleavage system transcriptional activator
MSRLPPLNALRAFEAAARHLSFSRAADELHVTPAAISHQIRALEEELGVPLFRRLTRAVRLTEAGQAAYPALREAFERLHEAVERARGPASSGLLTVSVAPSFASEWLLPRLDRFRAAHPGLEVRLDPSPRLADFERDGVDVAIRYGSGRHPSFRVERLFADEVFPVCSRALAAGPPPLRVPADLRGATLVHLDDYAMQGHYYPTWREWLLAAGVADIEPERGPRFTMANMSIQAAIAGLGVALASRVLVEDALAAGRLVRPFALALPLEYAYHLVAPMRPAPVPKVQAFWDWMLEEAARRPESCVVPDRADITAP